MTTKLGPKRAAPPSALLALATLASLLLITPAAHADEVVQIPVQGALLSAGGGPVADGVYVLFVRIYDAEKAAKPVWQEAQSKVTVAAGHFTFMAGSVDDKGIPMALLVAGKPLWIGMQVGSDEELPRVQLGVVPYAVQARTAAAGSFPYAASSKVAGPATALDCSGCVVGAMVAPSAIGNSHLAFTYAGSKQKGGSATHALAADEAKHALTADSATNADKATLANLATLAKEAAKATLADDVLAVSCTGCVGLKQLAGSVANGFVPVSGGTITGKLAVQGGLDLGSSAISGGHFAAIDVTKVACKAADIGQVALDTATKRLHFCDGSTWRRLSSCTGACKDPKLVACAQPVPDDCGELTTCKGAGSFCPPGQTCGAKGCASPGESKETALASCKALLAANKDAKSDVFWIDPNGGATDDAMQVYCDMTTDGGGWTLVMKLSAGSFCYGSGNWTASSTVNADKMLDATLPASAAYDAKSAAFYSMTDVTALRLATSKNKAVTVSFVKAASPRELMTTNTIDFAAYPKYADWKAAFGHDRGQAPIFMRAGVAVNSGNTCRTNPTATPTGCGQKCTFCYQAADGDCCPCAATANDVNSGLGQNSAYCGGSTSTCSTAGSYSDPNLRTLVWAR